MRGPVPPGSRPVVPALWAVACLLALASLYRVPQPPPPVPPVDPRIDPIIASKDEAFDDVGADTGFASALTSHTGSTYLADLDGISTRGVLRILTRNNAISYFLYRGEERGFDFEIAERMARELGVRLQMVVVPTRRDLVPWLLEGRGDLILAGMSTAAARSDRVRFSRPYLEDNWVVVTRARRDAPRLKTTNDLSGIDLLVRPSSAALPLLRKLRVPGGLTIVAAPERHESEDLLDEVAARRSPATVVEERVARLELLHRRDLKVALTLGPNTGAIAVRPDQPALFDFVDAFVAKNRPTSDWITIWRRYHEHPRTTVHFVNSRLRADKDGRLTPWDTAFLKAEKTTGIDWRLLVAMGVQESRLDPEAASPFGAVGIMQLLPSTAEELGCEDPSDPAQAISAAARYMKKLVRRFERPRASNKVALKDQVRFALAAYNVGAGHVDDARTLAASEGLDPDRWFGHVERAMSMLETPRFYASARHGYARGSETVRYVSEIQTRFDALAALAH